MSCFTRAGNTVNIKNNFISITAPNSSAVAVFGILIGLNGVASYESNVYGNSVRIGGTRLGGTLGGVSSYGILKSDTNLASTFRSKHNNVYINRVTGDANTEFQIASWVDNLNGTVVADSNNYYATDPLGGIAGGWVDSLYGVAGLAGYRAFASPNEASTTFNNVIVSKLRLTINFEACSAPTMVKVTLRNSTSPYAVVDSSFGFAGGGIDENFYFDNAVDGTPYYLVVSSANSIETWSAAPVSFTSSYVAYNFTTAVSQAYGNNMKLVSGLASIYQGDANQDGFVDGTDVILTYNDATGFITNPSTDFNCDAITDLSDIILAFNNGANFVQKQTPPVLDNIISDNTNKNLDTQRLKLINSNSFMKVSDIDVVESEKSE